MYAVALSVQWLTVPRCMGWWQPGVSELTGLLVVVVLVASQTREQPRAAGGGHTKPYTEAPGGIFFYLESTSPAGIGRLCTRPRVIPAPPGPSRVRLSVGRAATHHGPLAAGTRVQLPHFTTRGWVTQNVRPEHACEYPLHGSLPQHFRSPRATASSAACHFGAQRHTIVPASVHAMLRKVMLTRSPVF